MNDEDDAMKASGERRDSGNDASSCSGWEIEFGKHHAIDSPASYFEAFCRGRPDRKTTYKYVRPRDKGIDGSDDKGS